MPSCTALAILEFEIPDFAFVDDQLHGKREGLQLAEISAADLARAERYNHRLRFGHTVHEAVGKLHKPLTAPLTSY